MAWRTSSCVLASTSGVLSEAERSKVREKCANESSWLDKNSLAKKEAYDQQHLKECQRVCGPIMTKIHAGPGQKGPGPKGKKSVGKGTSSSPIVEEVD